jgi:hypothetical protein
MQVVHCPVPTSLFSLISSLQENTKRDSTSTQVHVRMAYLFLYLRVALDNMLSS